MQTSRRIKVLRVIVPILTILTIWFVFSNSLAVGSVSMERSDSVLQLFEKAFRAFGLSYETSSFLVRKMGHILEFALLSFLLCCHVPLYTRTPYRFISWPILIAGFTAVLDEYIQSFVPGRASQVQDILIDSLGIFIGFLTFSVLYQISQLFKK